MSLETYTPTDNTEQPLTRADVEKLLQDKAFLAHRDIIDLDMVRIVT